MLPFRWLHFRCFVVVCGSDRGQWAVQTLGHPRHQERVLWLLLMLSRSPFLPSPALIQVCRESGNPFPEGGSHVTPEPPLKDGALWDPRTLCLVS